MVGPGSPPEGSDLTGPQSPWSGHKAVPSKSKTSKSYTFELVKSRAKWTYGRGQIWAPGRVKPDAVETPVRTDFRDCCSRRT
eukprot:7708679-Alexandrium_andersonii.AAC.1